MCWIAKVSLRQALEVVVVIGIVTVVFLVDVKVESVKNVRNLEFLTRTEIEVRSLLKIDR